MAQYGSSSAYGKTQFKNKQYLDNYVESYKDFPKRNGPYSRLETPYKNKDLMRSKELDSDINSLLTTYKYATGTEYDIMESFNRISNDSLGYRLEDLPDVEKTLGGQQMLILLGDKLRKHRVQQQERPDMDFGSFEQMYDAYGLPNKNR